MTYKLHMNGIITGSVNCFCLVCDIFLTSQKEATQHTETAEHKKKLHAVQYSVKFKDEHIKKFNGGYYCEFCNILLPIASKVNLHVTEDEHKHNKGILLLKPMGGDVVAFNNILIEEKAWHGLIEGVCSLCNTEFEDDNEHKADTSHSLNLVLKPIQFGAGKAIYRHLDDTAVQCLTCNKLLAPCRMTKHFDDTEHHELYAKRRIETNGVCQAIDTNMTSVTENDDDDLKKLNIENDTDNNKKSPAKDKSKIFESIAKYQSKQININLETETAFCKKCSQVITFDFMEIENHIENHSSVLPVDSDLQYPSNLDQNLNRVDINDKTTQLSEETTEAQQAKVQIGDSNAEDNDTDDSSSFYIPPNNDFEKCSPEDEAKEFANANKINYNGDNNQSYCRICKVHVPASLRSMKEHVAGANHKKVAASSKDTTTSSTSQLKNPGRQSKQESHDFIDSAYTVEGIFYKASIVNEKYCIPLNSFYLIKENNSRIRCIICEVNLPPFSDIEDHVEARQHKLKFYKVPFIISERNEFIREVRPGLYHCGYCNLVVSGWSEMKQHLECSDHRESRDIGENRFRYHLPAIQQFKMRKQMEVMAVMRFFNMF